MFLSGTLNTHFKEVNDIPRKYIYSFLHCI